MADTIGSRIKNAWNAFLNRDPTEFLPATGVSYGYRPDRVRPTRNNERTIVNAIINKISVDVSDLSFEHVKLDENGRYLETIDSTLNECLTLSANKDQTSVDFIRDVVQSMFDEGTVCILPVDTSANPLHTESYKIYSMRTAKILEWMPDKVRIRAYNDKIGEKEEIVRHKSTVAIIENPFFSVINEPNSIFKRLVRKLALLDQVDEQSSSGRLDLIIQLPYVIRNPTKKNQAELRRKELEDQLVNSKYGIGYTDGTEKIVQLNRPVENNLMKQIEYLTNLLYSQMGITQSIMDGSADEKTMLNYTQRVVKTIAVAIVSELKRKFLSKTARSQGQSIMFFRDHFSLVPVSELAEIADKFTRNEILTSNEVRQKIGMPPSNDPRADELRNKNLSAPADSTPVSTNAINSEASGKERISNVLNTLRQRRE